MTHEVEVTAMARKTPRSQTATKATKPPGPGPQPGSMADTERPPGPTAYAPGGTPRPPRCDKCMCTLYTVVRRIVDREISREIDGKQYNLAIRRTLRCKNCDHRYHMWFLEFTGRD